MKIIYMTPTPTDLQALITSEVSMKLGAKTTIVLWTLDSGFEILGTASCADPEMYNEETGISLARADAANQLAKLSAYAEAAIQNNPIYKEKPKAEGEIQHELSSKTTT